MLAVSCVSNSSKTSSTFIALCFPLIWAIFSGLPQIATAQEAGFPSPLELDFFPSCACEQDALPQPGTWAIEVQSFIMRDALDSLNSHDGDDNGFFDADLSLRREFCGDSIDFPYSAKPPLNLLVRFAPDASGSWTLVPGSKPMGGTGAARLTPRGGIRPPKAFDGSLTSKSINGIADFLFTLTLLEGETPGLKPSPVMNRIAELTLGRVADWPQLSCWCRAAEQSYRTSWQMRQAFLDPDLLASAEGLGAFAGKIPFFKGQPSWDALASGDYDVRNVVTKGGENYQTLVNEFSSATILAEGYDPTDHIYSRGSSGELSRVGGTTLATCSKTVSSNPSGLLVTEAATHIHENVHVADCLRAKEAYRSAHSDRPSLQVADEVEFAQAWFNTPANLSDSEARAYAADMRFLLNFHQTHCRPIISKFDLD